MADAAVNNTETGTLGPEAVAGAETAEAKKKKELVMDKMEMVKQNLKDGKDQQGKMLFEAYTEGIVKKDGSEMKGVMGNLNRMFNTAWESKEKINDPGEANKLHSTLEQMYKAAHLGEYQVQLPPDTNEADKPRLIREQMEKDLSEFAAKATTEFLMAEYVDMTAKMEVERDLLGEAVKEDNLSRAKVRGHAFELQRMAKKRAKHTEARLEQVYPQKISRKEKKRGKLNPHVKEFRRLEEARNDFREEAHVPLNRRTEMSDLVDEATKNFRNELGYDQELEDKGEKQNYDVQALENMDAGVKRDLSTELAGVDLAIKDKQKQLENAAKTERRDTICKLASELKALKLERKTTITKFKSAIIEQRRVNSGKNLMNSFRELGLAFGTDVDDKKQTTGEAIKQVKENLGEWFKSQSKFGIKGELAKGVEIVAKGVQNVKEFGQRMWKAADNMFGEQVRKIGSAIRVGAQSIRDRFVAHDARETAELQSKRLDKKRKKYEKKHEKDNKNLMKKADKVIDKKHGKWKRRNFLGRTVLWLTRASEEQKKQVREKREEIATHVEERKRGVHARIEARKNKYFAQFEDDLIQKAVEISPERQTRPEADNGDIEDKFSQVAESHTKISEELGKLPEGTLTKEQTDPLRKLVDGQEASGDDEAVPGQLSNLQALNRSLESSISTEGLSADEFNELNTRLTDKEKQINEAPTLIDKTKAVQEYYDLVKQKMDKYRELSASGNEDKENSGFDPDKIRKGASYMEMVHVKGKGEKAGEDRYILFWWDKDKKRLTREMVDQKGNKVGTTPDSNYDDVTSEQIARQLINQEFVDKTETKANWNTDKYDVDRNVKIEAEEEKSEADKQKEEADKLFEDKNDDELLNETGTLANEVVKSLEDYVKDLSNSTLKHTLYKNLYGLRTYLMALQRAHAERWDSGTKKVVEGYNSDISDIIKYADPAQLESGNADEMLSRAENFKEQSDIKAKTLLRLLSL